MLRHIRATWPQQYPGFRFHAAVAFLAALWLSLTIAGCLLTHLTVPGITDVITRYVAMGPVAIWILVQFWRTGHRRSFEALLLYLEIKVFEQIAGPSIGVVAHLGRRIPLADQGLKRIDFALGVSTSGIATWSRGHHLLFPSLAIYLCIGPFIVLAFFVPVFQSRLRVARVYVGANLLAFLFAYPALFFFPAIGPWFASPMATIQAQNAVEASLFSLRRSGPCVLGNPAVVSIPSFHVIWAILCAYSLWQCSRMRVPAAIFSLLVILSTLTTGWHYFADVLAGILVGSLSIALSSAFVMATDPFLKQADEPMGAGAAPAESY
ncbi:MAG: phosphatase PAP2 family protein [Terracidiphilus sp.]